VGLALRFVDEPPAPGEGRLPGAEEDELKLPKLDMTDGGFNWTREELEQATRTALEWLFSEE
jgi:hypothetical protein